MNPMNPYGVDYFEPVAADAGLNALRHNSCKLLDFQLLILNAGEKHTFASGEREYGVVVLTGTADISVSDTSFKTVGGRRSVFAGPPSMVYAGCGAEVTIQAAQRLEVALCSCPSATPIAPYRVDPGDCFQGRWGRFNTARTFNYMIDGRRPSERLHLAEVTAPSGNWATYPPHKHEYNAPERGEIFQEEMYFYRADPVEGFGFCALYGGKVEQDYAFMVRHNTILKMPYGYHTIVAAPGYKIWYLALIAGDTKAHSPIPDPNYAWWNKADIALENVEQNLLG